MIERLSRRASAVLCGALVALAGCGGSSSGAPATPDAERHPTSSTKATTSSNLPEPAATEVNPPGDIPDDQVFVRFRPPGSGFTVRVPEGWARSSTEGEITFTDKLNSIGIASARTPGKPTAATVRARELPTVEKRGGNYKPGSVTTIHRKSGTAVLAKYLQDSAPDPVTNKVVRDAVERYSFWHRGIEVIVTLSGPKGADNVDPWRLVSDSLTWR